MANRPLPESIRGSWYYIDQDADPHDLGDKPPQVLTFRLDGTFTRYIAKGPDDWMEKESGEYTFDGSFLIIRGRNTDTFRVKPHAFWRWNLEGKKQQKALLRGLVTDDDFVDLPDEDKKEIRILPIRVGIEAPSDVDGVIYDLVFKREEKERKVGNFFVERDEQKLWVGVSPFTNGIEERTWERIVRESYLDIFKGKPDDVRVVTVRMLDTDQSRVFNYTVD
jgi:hypothetical protein